MSTYCYVCLMHLRQGNTLNYSYKNGLGVTVTGTINSVTTVVLGLLDTILGGTSIAFQDPQNNPMGVYAACSVRGTSLCVYHVVVGQVS